MFKVYIKSDEGSVGYPASVQLEFFYELFMGAPNPSQLVGYALGLSYN